MISNDDISQLKNFLDDKGRLKQYPKKMKPKMLALAYIASKFEPEKEYSEEEINTIIKSWHSFDDHALLRRDLYTHRFLGRLDDGSMYWLEGPWPRETD
ncbi:MAG: DUF2087 domain-containing protein [Clostridiales bacterium]|nr:DUF2087 domain-containing protein [Clostridiales bacterium]